MLTTAVDITHILVRFMTRFKFTNSEITETKSISSTVDKKQLEEEYARIKADILLKNGAKELPNKTDKVNSDHKISSGLKKKYDSIADSHSDDYNRDSVHEYNRPKSRPYPPMNMGTYNYDISPNYSNYNPSTHMQNPIVLNYMDYNQLHMYNQRNMYNAQYEAQYGMHNAAQYGMHNAAQYEIHNAAQYGMHNAAQYEIHNAAQYGMHNAQYGMHNAAQYGMHNAAQYEIHNAAQYGMHNAAQYGMHNAAQYAQCSTIWNAQCSTIWNAQCSTIWNAQCSTIWNAAQYGMHSTVPSTVPNTVPSTMQHNMECIMQYTIWNAQCSTIWNA